MTDRPSVAVSKRLVTDEYAYPSVRLRVSTDADEPVAVRLVESLPPGVDETAVGFHEDEGYEHWSVTGGDRIVYEDVVRESQPASTLYAIVDATPDQLEACLDTPSVELARTDDPDSIEAADWTPLDDERIDASIDDADGGDARPADRQTSPTGGDWGGSDSTMNQNEQRTTEEQDGEPTADSAREDAAAETDDQRGGRGQAAGDGEAAALTRGGTSADSGASTPTGSSIEFDATPSSGTVEPDTSASGGTAGPDAAASSEAAGPDVPTQPEPHDSVVEQFAEELRRDDPSSQAVATLRSHLGADTAGSVEAKLDHCMTRIGELDAYVDALESFLDGEGTAEQLLAEVRDDLRTVEAHVEDVERRVESVETAQSRLNDRLASVESDLDTVEELDHAVDDIDETVTEARAELTDAVAEVEAEVSALGEDLESVEEWRSSVVQALSATQESASAPASNADRAGGESE